MFRFTNTLQIKPTEENSSRNIKHDVLVTRYSRVATICVVLFRTDHVKLISEYSTLSVPKRQTKRWILYCYANVRLSRNFCCSYTTTTYAPLKVQLERVSDFEVCVRSEFDEELGRRRERASRFLPCSSSSSSSNSHANQSVSARTLHHINVFTRYSCKKDGTGCCISPHFVLGCNPGLVQLFNIYFIHRGNSCPLCLVQQDFSIGLRMYDLD